MNRKKKINSILRKRAKKAKAKLAPKHKSAYISKSERETLPQAEQAESISSDAEPDTNAEQS